MLNSMGTSAKCPITGMNIELDKFIQVPPINNSAIVSNINIDVPMFNRNNYERVNISDMTMIECKNLELKESTGFEFQNYPYEFLPKVPIFTEKLFKEKIQYRTSEEFNNQIKLRYDWLEQLNMTNVVIAGGFCKSLIFDEKVNDIDMYLYGLEDNQKYVDRLGTLVNDLNNLMYAKYLKVVSLHAYKKEFNVYEIIYFDNVKDIIKTNYQLEDLTQMKYISKIQIILKKQNDITDIFNTYDIDSCCVMWDGTRLLFNERSYFAYKYLVNIPRVDRFYSDIYDMRLIKYYNSGFRIALPTININQINQKIKNNDENEKNILIINRIKFHINEIIDNYIYIDKIELIEIKEPVQENQTLGEEKKEEEPRWKSGYNTIIGDLGSLDDSRSIVKFMRYVKRQNRIYEKAKNKLNGIVEDEDEIDEDEETTELKKLKLFGRNNVKKLALEEDEDEEDEDEKILDKKISALKNEPKKNKTICKFVNDNNTDGIELLPLCDNKIINPLLENNENVEEEEIKNPEDYIKVYYKVHSANNPIAESINCFDNGNTKFTFISDYDGFHICYDDEWYKNLN